MSHAVFGISFGNSCARIAAYKDGKKNVLANDFGERFTPTFVTYLENEKIIGHSAKQSLHKNAANTACCIALLLGKSFDDTQTQDAIKELPCKVVEKDGEVYFKMIVSGKEVVKPVTEALTDIFKKLYETGKSFDMDSDMKVVIATPEYFSDEGRETVRKCATKAGFEVLRLISEPSAACLEYGIGQSDRRMNCNILVYNLGMCVLDTTILHVSGGMYRTATNLTENNVGGQLFDDAIADFLASEFKKQWKTDVRQNKRAMYKLRAAGESAKHTLSNNQTASVHLESLHEGIDFQLTVSRGRFEGMCSSLFRSCVEPVQKVLEKAGLAKDEVHHVILAGGSCKLPYLQHLLKEELPSAEHHHFLPPSEVVVLGCANQAGIIGGRAIGHTDDTDKRRWIACTPHDLWISSSAMDSPVLLLPKFTPVPCYSTASVVLSKGCNPSNDSLVEIYEADDSKQKVIAKITVPMLSDCDKVVANVSISWQDDNTVSVTASHKDSSEWQCDVQLECETV